MQLLTTNVYFLCFWPCFSTLLCICEEMKCNTYPAPQAELQLSSNAGTA